MTERATSGEAEFALMVLVDDFKVVNDSLGREKGDALLIGAAERLSGVVGEHGTVTRTGGDEFAVLLPMAAEPAAGWSRGAHPGGVLPGLLLAGKRAADHRECGHHRWRSRSRSG